MPSPGASTETPPAATPLESSEAPRSDGSLLHELRELQRDLEQANRRLDALSKRVVSSLECRVCMDRIADHVLVPSGQAICFECGRGFVGSKDPWTTELVASVMRVYLPILT